ncbi:tRNA lysidine(34) synthetase TilS [Sphingobacterium olei]|uniref:tRNA(Ile)-lysidine synthase n=1 Tax=Sphingobacterium olei TaxID=2571155 RepID=A0A4U0P1V7_9SPHI|nr:tRNA lysidine(34) synthetase TilS [Sphingobacterium olei]TJZ61185.1 tRNA lysidine(34) synthetase TilS [Sphingobacterium olei]
MVLLDRFKSYCFDNELFAEGDRILLAVSGGRDSMLMVTLFLKVQINIEIAHCNFGLRGQESDGDESLVRVFAQQHGIPFHVKKFDTVSYAEMHKISIQMAARDLRYGWFNDLARELDCRYIAVAQHKNDHIETVLLNLARGTGLQGLQGIKPKRDNIIRPLLFLTAAEVSSVAEELKVPFRDDSSNFSTKYARNKIRLDIIPQFESLNADFIDTMDKNIQRFQENYVLLQSFINPLRSQLFETDAGGGWKIKKEDLSRQSMPLLYALFEPFGFSIMTLQDLLKALTSNAESGRIFESNKYQLLLDRTYVLLKKKDRLATELDVSEDATVINWLDKTFEILLSEHTEICPDVQVAQIDYNRLIFPLKVRSWKEGDTFYPLGMQGKKKLSDYFVDRKVSLFDKKAIPIWVNGNGEIIWISGYRLDDRYKITDNTQKVLTLVCK